MQLAQVLGLHAVTLSRWETEAPSAVPSEYEEQLLRRFDCTQDPEKAGFEAARLLVRKGPIDALHHLLVCGAAGLRARRR